MGGTDDVDDNEQNTHQGRVIKSSSESTEDSASNSSAYEKKRHKKRSSRHHRHDRDHDDDDDRHHKKEKKDHKHQKKKKKNKHHRHRRSRSDSEDTDDEEDKSRHKKKHRSSLSSSREKDHEAWEDKNKDTIQSTFGKYGIIRESDFRTSGKIRRSFEVWLEETRGIPQGSNVTKNELANYFKDYMEDFNTATLPHIKFYDYDKWEAEEYQRNKNEVMKQGSSTAKSDEFFHREEMWKKEEEKRRKEMELIRSGMTKEKVEEMKHQARLKAEMVNAYKTGDEEKRKRLQKRLEPEEDAFIKR